MRPTETTATVVDLSTVRRQRTTERTADQHSPAERATDQHSPAERTADQHSPAERATDQQNLFAIDSVTGSLVAQNRRSRAARLRAQADLVPSLMSSAYIRRAVELECEAHLIERLPA